MLSRSPNPTRTYGLRHLHLPDLCRICLQPTDYLKNSGHKLTTRICKMLQTSTQISVSVDDGCPQVICNQCYKQLYETYKFILLAKNTSRKFRRLDQTVIKTELLTPEHSDIDIDTKEHLLLIKENIENNLNQTEFTLNKRRGRKRNQDVIIIENNNSIDLTTSPIVDKIQIKTEKIYELPVIKPEPILDKIITRSSNSKTQEKTYFQQKVLRNRSVNVNTIKYDTQTSLLRNSKQNNKRKRLKLDVEDVQMHEKQLDCPVLSEIINFDVNKPQLLSPAHNSRKRRKIQLENVPNDKLIKLENESDNLKTNNEQRKSTPLSASKNSTKTKPIEKIKKEINKKYPILVENKKQLKILPKKTAKKPKKEIIKVSTIHLTRSIKKEIIESKKKSRQKKQVELKPAGTSLDEILNAVGLVRKSSTESQPKYECRECGDTFPLAEPYKRHVARRHGLRPYTCRLCGYACASRTALREHKRDTHTGPHCNVSFNTSEQFLLHKSDIHSHNLAQVSNACHECAMCGRRFSKASDLSRHERVHTGERPYVCVVCRAAFQQPHSLTKHMVVHTRERAFPCQVCHRQFGRRDSALRHMLTHSPHKPHVCAHCKRDFARHTQLQAHMRNVHDSHTDISKEL